MFCFKGRVPFLADEVKRAYCIADYVIAVPGVCMLCPWAQFGAEVGVLIDASLYQVNNEVSLRLLREILAAI